ncbi:nucleotide sugar dehydrogenase [Anaerosalibacter massiliensis]|uniref:Nucleotide sugar dehydrogenase n=1 Tax=Anaerosalibacter massiliensis TaxID=1347392 RepID=A0A9X2S675_9FIRM|nr:nucleotide sugar dehydrogenase [Anaerosalibacter massiliensis]
MNLYQDIKERKEKLSVVGLGYVGLPLAIAFGKKADVIGFDINEKKIKLYNDGIDVTEEVGDGELKKSVVNFTSDEKKIREAKFHIVSVPTPINEDKTPNLNPLKGATRTVGRNLTKGSVVVYESTVYPGVTEEVCIPILEEESNMKCGQDFKVGYSPERINPGDKKHRLENIVKIVSAVDDESLDIISKVYELVVEVGVHKAESIKVAEAAKVIENSQRDINIAFMNELSIIFNKLDIDTKAVLEAAATKWNFLNFTPGLVGGHCIGIDPYYLTYKAEQIGYHSQIILSGRKINDGMGKHVAEHTVKNMIKADKQVKGSKVAIMGLTFKENCPDVRNTKVIDIIKELEEYGVDVLVVDPASDAEEVYNEYGIKLWNIEDIKNIDAVIFAVAHDEFKSLTLENILNLYNGSNGKVLVDVKGIFEKDEAENLGYIYWRL